MPPQLLQLLQNRRVQITLAIGVVVIIIAIIAMAAMGGGNKQGTARRLGKDEMVLATVENIGKALEVQALLARERISLTREDVEGGKATLRFQEGATTDERDRALITLVQSGLMDKNVGLEIFEKGDLTASREEKRIKLIRARNGELSRLIRKIDPIQDASVFISMPEPTIFKRDMVPTSATVQVTLSPGERLTRDKVRSIINLLVGSIETLDAKHVSLTDTNGNVYNSVLDATDELMDRLEERDRYMEQKVKTQLDKLLGTGKYVATVSTYLREAPKSQLQLDYDPKASSVAKSAQFQENLNSQQKGSGLAAGPVSTYVPDEIDISASGNERSQRGYNRNGQEVEFNAGKKQTSEDFVPGMMEEITIAVTVEEGSMPETMAMESFQELIARAASPLVRPENVTVVVGKPEIVLPPPLPPQNKFDIPWWVWAIASGVIFIFFLLLLGALNKPTVHPQILQQHQDEIKQLRELSHAQAQQLQATQQQAAEAIKAQQEQLAQLTTQQQPQIVQQAPQEGAALELKQALSDIKEALASEDDELDEELGTEIRSWIEST